MTRSQSPIAIGNAGPVSGPDIEPVTERILVLDAMRGLAALCVMIHHEPAYHNSAGLMPRGYLAVDFFFLLSGFVLTLTYEPRFGERLRPARFLAERFARLGPLMALGIVIGAAAWANHSSTREGFTVLVMALLLIPSLVGTGALYPANGPMWSVVFELIANVFHATALRKLHDRHVLIVASLCGLGLSLAVLANGQLKLGDETHNWAYGFVRVGFSYTLGVWLGRRHRSANRRWAMPWWIPLALLPSILCVASLLPLASGDLLIAIGVMPPLLWFSAGAQAPEWTAPALRWLGALSFPLYALHVPLICFTLALAAKLGVQDYLVFRVGAIAAIVAVSAKVGASPLARGMKLPPRLRATDVSGHNLGRAQG